MVGWSDHTIADICHFTNKDYRTWLVEKTRGLRQEQYKGLLMHECLSRANPKAISASQTLLSLAAENKHDTTVKLL